MAQLLLHSLSEFSHVILPLLDELDPSSVLEIGSETGIFSEELFKRARSGHELHTVEPFPTPALLDKARESHVFHLHVGTSLDYLTTRVCKSDFVLVDGDHNWFTVYNELMLLESSWREHNIRDGVILLHDVGWPNGRRDFYYNPAKIPAQYLHPHSYDHGVVAGQPGAFRNAGFRGNGAFAWALREGGPRNGVLTAVEDFMKERPGFTYRHIDAVFGLGALTYTGSKADAAVDKAFAPYQNPLVQKLEQNRLELYLKVIELQDTLWPQEVPAGAPPQLRSIGGGK